MPGLWKTFWGVLLAVTCLAAPAAALVEVRFEPSSSNQPLGSTFDVDILADMSDPILGWGLDVTFDSGILMLVGTPTIGPAWTPVFAPDGDGLAGGVFPSGISGTDILLATLSFEALQLGFTDLTLGVTPADLNEGFALDPTGFDAVNFNNGQLQVVPEPSTAFLLGVALAAVAARRSPHRGRHFAARSR